MSSFASYDREAARVHAIDRPPTALRFVRDCVRRLVQPSHKVAILDAGCGAGGYALGLCNNVGSIVALDSSPSMLEAARGLLSISNVARKVALVRARIEALPFGEGRFDVVMFNQVLHHLEPGDDPTYGATANALSQAAKVLRPDGALVFNLCSHEQLRQGFWYYALIPEAVDEAIKRCVPLTRLFEMLQALGFTVCHRAVSVEPMQGKVYLDGQGPLSADWRRTDSIWDLVDPVQLQRVKRHLIELRGSETLGAFVAAHDASRVLSGQATQLMAIRKR